jgi:hypothetical protein
MRVSNPWKYQLPHFLRGTLDQAIYERWLQRKAVAHVKRDRKRGNTAAMIEAYKVAIHQAVSLSKGLDAYTGETLKWDLVSKYDNEASKAGRRQYKAALGLLPTVDHVGDGLGEANFKICAWRTNDAKNDLSYLDFVDLCRRVIERHGQENP